MSASTHNVSFGFIRNMLGPELGRRLVLFGIIIILPLVLGVVFRFANLDRKVYWADEAHTSLWLSGYGREEIISQAFDGREIGVEDLKKYQRVTPGRGLADSIVASAGGEPQMPPLYPMLLRIWVMIFSDSITSTRSLSALMSVLTLAAIYWLSLELFGSRFTAWVAVALLSLSPFQVAYAQEARAYSLWMLLIVISTAALLRSLRHATLRSWALYALTAALGMYAHGLFGVVIVAHAGYVAGVQELFRKRWEAPKLVKQYALATGVAMAASAPWVIAAASHLDEARQFLNWATFDFGLQWLFLRWGSDITTNLFDLGRTELELGDNGLLRLMLVPTVFLLDCLMAYALYHLLRQSPKRVWLLIFLLIGCNFAVLIVPDLLWGGRRSAVPRYLSPCYLSIELAVAYLFATHLFSQQRWQRIIGRILLAGVLLGGIASGIVGSQAVYWWTKALHGKRVLDVARLVNQADRPLLISDASRSGMGNMLALSYLLNQEVRLQIVYQSEELQIRNRFPTVFLFNVSDSFRQKLERDLKAPFELVSERWRLWHTVRKTDD